MIKKVRKKLGQQKWKLKKKTRETKVWLQKKKKEEKLKTWASSKLKIKKNKKHFFPLLSKKSWFYNDSEKKSIPFFRRKNRWFINLIFFYCCFFCLVLCLPLWLFWAIFGKKTWLCYYSTIITTYYYYYYMLMCNLCSMHIKSRFE